eukprot:357369-Chlamydomonas_euryale.AAC.7
MARLLAFPGERRRGIPPPRPPWRCLRGNHRPHLLVGNVWAGTPWAEGGSAPPAARAERAERSAGGVEAWAGTMRAEGGSAPPAARAEAGSAPLATRAEAG